MRTAALFVVFVFFLVAACTARAESQGNAGDCESALSKMAPAMRANLHCLSKEEIARIVDELGRTGAARRAAEAGIETPVLASLAARLKPAQEADLAKAAAEVSHASNLAIDLVSEAGRGSGGQLTDQVLQQIAERIKANDLDAAARAAEEGFARWQALGQKSGGKEAAGVAMLEAALKTDLLLFDAAAAAGQAERIVELQYAGDKKAAFAALRERRLRFYLEGRGEGVNSPLEVAMAIARREMALAQGPEQRGIALSDLGMALESLGELGSEPEQLEEAVSVFRKALKELPRPAAALDWAKTQNNLGLALALLGERENGTKRLDEAVLSYRAALTELSRERSPRDWAQTQFNLGNALLSLAQRESGRKRLEEAVIAYREALKELPRERAPFQWAAAQNSLGTALSSLGEGEGGTEKLEEAAAAFREALKERTRQQSPLNWAFTQMNLSMIYRALFDKDRKASHLNDALEAVDGALEEFRNANAAFYVGEAERQRQKILAIDPDPAAGPSSSDPQGARAR